MASLRLCPQFKTNLMPNGKVIELLLQLTSAKVHGKNYIKVKPTLVHHLMRKRVSLQNETKGSLTYLRSNKPFILSLFFLTILH